MQHCMQNGEKNLCCNKHFCDLSVLKIYSIVLTFMLPNFGNVTNAGGHIKYLIFVFSNKITVVFCVCLYFVNFCLFKASYIGITACGYLLKFGCMSRIV